MQLKGRRADEPGAGCLPFALGLPQRSLHSQTREGSLPGLFISHFLPYGRQMETGRDVIAQFTSSTALFFILILNFSESL